MGEQANKNEAVEKFITRWQGREGGQERANYVSFLNELIALLELQPPDPADATHENNDYVFERVVKKQRAEGDSQGRIDLYKKGSFVLEAKQSRIKGGKKEVAGQNDLFTTEVPESSRGRRGADRAWDVLMLNAKRQAEEYARALPTSHGWPPFILVCDVGHCIEVYADFSGQGKNYTQFPDRQSFRVYLEDLREPEVRERFQKIWNEPEKLDPTQTSAKVTRDIAKRLAQVSLALEKKNYPAQDVAMFLMRCLFTMFAEDVGLLPEKSFKDVLEECEKAPDTFVPVVTQLWEAMNTGGFAHALKKEVKKFNGEFFRNKAAMPLGCEEIGELRQAASYNWKEVDPSIFGTLVEQALDAVERQRLGAHYTPRAYVERLVIATIIEPLREDWRNVQAAAEIKRNSGDLKGAAAEVSGFHEKLCETRVLDPACGTGNFLYVSLELMKRLEGEVLEALLDLGGQEALRGLGSHSIDPHQFLGLEVNPRAAAIAELVLWIGYLQWHFRTKGGAPDEPILRAFKNIQVKNAVLTWDGEPVPVIVDGKETYPNARRPDWPPAEFIVGNPPFIGTRRLKERLGAEYVVALRSAYPNTPETVDLVMYWWVTAAELVKLKVVRCAGLITTNSITQDYNRVAIEKFLAQDSTIELVFAVTNHPWLTTSDGASVRVAMTVLAEKDVKRGKILAAVQDVGGDDTIVEKFVEKINTTLRDIPDVLSTSALLSNKDMCLQGVVPAGAGFKIPNNDVRLFSENERSLIKRYVIGLDITDKPQNTKIIDLFGMGLESVRTGYQKIYQHLSVTVKPERDKNPRDSYKDKWWIFAEPRPKFREMVKGINRYIGTPYTAHHRLFVFLESSIIPDAMVYSIPSDDSFVLGTLSANIHLKWCQYCSGTLETRPRYNSKRTFYPFPFPDANNIQKRTIRVIAEELDAHRKRVLAEHPHLTLTGLYNVLENLRAGTKPDELDKSDRAIFDDGLVLILKELHDRLDLATADSYGWPADLSDEDILSRLVALNKERAEEEKRGLVRWLRPDYQIPRFGKKLDKQAAREEGAQVAAQLDITEKVQLPSFPAGAVEQTAAVFAVLAGSSAPINAKSIAAQFKKTKTTEKKIEDVLASLARLGHVMSSDGISFVLRRVA